MYAKKSIWIWVLILLFSGCQKDWEEYYYGNDEPTVDQNMWEVISEDPALSDFVEYARQTGADSLFTSGNSITVFVPDNEAFANLSSDTLDLETLLDYHFLETVVNLQNIDRSKKMETRTGKYALLENSGEKLFIDGIPVNASSPLFLNGRYYVIDEVLLPRPTLYELISSTNRYLKDYIDQFDSVYLDVTRSTPIGYDEQGNTIYDSVFTRFNLFDSLYFPIQDEFRNKAATMILFDEQQYEDALSEMALNLGDAFQTYEDIPYNWQKNVLLPRLIDDRVFGEALRIDDFNERMKNINGDSIDMDYLNIDENSRFICSNGVSFRYEDFSVADSLYKGEIRVQGESLVELIATGVYGWREGVTITGTSKSPSKVVADVADNDTLVNLELGINYTDDMMLEFYIRDVLPQRYRLVWRANYRPSGTYEVYVNDELMGDIDLFDMRSTRISVTGEYFVPEGGINKVDFWVDNIDEYGDVKIGLKYIDPGFQTFNGFSIDYISLVPEGE